MNIRFIAASAIALGVLTSGAFAGSSNYLVGSGAGLSDTETNFAIGRNFEPVAAATDLSTQGLAVTSSFVGIGDYIDETNAESNQRSSNR